MIVLQGRVAVGGIEVSCPFSVEDAVIYDLSVKVGITIMDVGKYSASFKPFGKFHLLHPPYKSPLPCH